MGTIAQATVKTLKKEELNNQYSNVKEYIYPYTIDSAVLDSSSNIPLKAYLDVLRIGYICIGVVHDVTTANSVANSILEIRRVQNFPVGYYYFVVYNSVVKNFDSTILNKLDAIPGGTEDTIYIIYRKSANSAATVVPLLNMNAQESLNLEELTLSRLYFKSNEASVTGKIKLEQVPTNKAVSVSYTDNTTANFYTTGGITANS